MNERIDKSNLSGGPDLDTVRRDAPDVVDQDDKPQDNPRLYDDRSGAPSPTAPPNPTGEDPFVAGSPEATGGFTDELDRDSVSTPIGDGPTYERDQGPADDNTGGSTDPHNTLGHADSGRPER